MLDMSPNQNYHHVLSLANKTVCCPPLATAITTAHFVTKFHQGMTYCSSPLPLDLRVFFRVSSVLLCFLYIIILVGTLTIDVLVSDNTSI